MTGHCMSRQEVTSAPQTGDHHTQSPNPNFTSPPSTKAAISLQHESSTLTNLSSQTLPILADISDAELTPPTSSSGFSSQDRPTFDAHDGFGQSFECTNPDALSFLTSNPPTNILEGTGSALEHITASKRTSSGQIKRANVLGANVLEKRDATISGHSRTASLLSNGSSVAEVGSIRPDFGSRI